MARPDFSTSCVSAPAAKLCQSRILQPALSLLGSAYDHIDLTAAAFRADQPLAPIGHGRFGTVPLSHLGRVGLDLMLAFPAPNDQPDAGGGSIAERHRRYFDRNLLPATTFAPKGSPDTGYAANNFSDPTDTEGVNPHATRNVRSGTDNCTVRSAPRSAINT
jgi:hypothetical protein